MEGYLLAGDNGNLEVNEALRHLFKERIFTGEVFVNGDWSMSLAVHPETWEAKLPELIPTYEVEKIERYHYLCRTLKFDWRSNIPGDFSHYLVLTTLLEGRTPGKIWVNHLEEPTTALV